MRIIAILLLFISGLAFSGLAMAQAMPPFNIPQMITNEEVANLAVDFDDAFNTIDNPYFSDTMKLNYQISLLEKLVARQAQVEKISDSYDAMGLAYKAPAPPRGICAQLPVNAPCLESYPDLYSDLVSARKAYYRSLQEKAKASEPGRIAGESDEEVAARMKKIAAEKAAKAAAAERKVRYQWTDLTCLSTQCHGVLVKATNADARYTVRSGSHLPDGTIVQNVSPDGVRVTIDGESIRVRPAPTNGSAENESGSNPIEAALAKAGVGDAAAAGPDKQLDASKAAAAAVIANAGGAPAAPAASIISPPAPMPASGSAASNAGDPPLGPSGLF
jgi:hypothetical protein